MTSHSTAGAMAGHPVARGIGLYVLAIFLLSVMDAVIKWLAPDYPTMQIVFFRSLFGLLPLAVLVTRAGGVAALRTGRPGGHLLRGLLSLGARSEEHTSELQSLMRISYAVFCLKKKNKQNLK